MVIWGNIYGGHAGERSTEQNTPGTLCRYNLLYYQIYKSHCFFGPHFGWLTHDT